MRISSFRLAQVEADGPKSSDLDCPSYKDLSGLATFEFGKLRIENEEA